MNDDREPPKNTEEKFERLMRGLDVFINHYDDSLIKVVLWEHPNCGPCMKLIDTGNERAKGNADIEGD